jgi:hypothetical protein
MRGESDWRIGADLWKIRATVLQYPRATVTAGTVHAKGSGGG